MQFKLRQLLENKSLPYLKKKKSTAPETHLNIKQQRVKMKSQPNSVNFVKYIFDYIQLICKIIILLLFHEKMLM